MAGPKEIQEKLERSLNSWRTLTPEKSYGGMTAAQFETDISPSMLARAEVEELEVKLTEALARRDAADLVSLAKLQLVVAGIVGDPTEGPDSAIYKAFGYTPKSERKTGLTRKRNGSKGSKE